MVLDICYVRDSPHAGPHGRCIEGCELPVRRPGLRDHRIHCKRARPNERHRQRRHLPEPAQLQPAQEK